MRVVMNIQSERSKLIGFGASFHAEVKLIRGKNTQIQRHKGGGDMQREVLAGWGDRRERCT